MEIDSVQYVCYFLCYAAYKVPSSSSFIVLNWFLRKPPTFLSWSISCCDSFWAWAPSKSLHEIGILGFSIVKSLQISLSPFWKESQHGLELLLVVFKLAMDTWIKNNAVLPGLFSVFLFKRWVISNDGANIIGTNS